MKISSLSSYLPSSANIPTTAKIVIGTAAGVVTLWASYQAAVWMFPTTLPTVVWKILPTPLVEAPLDKRLALGAAVAALGAGVLFAALDDSLTSPYRRELEEIKADLDNRDREIAHLNWSNELWRNRQQEQANRLPVL